LKANKKIIKISEFKIEEIDDFDTYVEADSKLYMLDGAIKGNYIPRNVVYNCEKEGADPKILRISFLEDRSQNDYLRTFCIMVF